MVEIGQRPGKGDELVCPVGPTTRCPSALLSFSHVVTRSLWAEVLISFRTWQRNWNPNNALTFLASSKDVLSRNCCSGIPALPDQFLSQFLISTKAFQHDAKTTMFCYLKTKQTDKKTPQENIFSNCLLDFYNWHMQYIVLKDPLATNTFHF